MPVRLGTAQVGVVAGVDPVAVGEMTLVVGIPDVVVEGLVGAEVGAPVEVAVVGRVLGVVVVGRW